MDGFALRRVGQDRSELKLQDIQTVILIGVCQAGRCDRACAQESEDFLCRN